MILISTFERREQILKLRVKVLHTEQERVSCGETITASEARKRLREHIADTQTEYTKLFY